MKRFIALTLVSALLCWSGAPAAVLAAEATTLEGIDVGTDEVILHLSEQVKTDRITTTNTSDPDRLVIDLLDVEHASPVKSLEGDGQYLRKVRSGQYQRDPNLITRIVLDLLKPAAAKVAWAGRDMVVSLRAGAAGPAKRPGEGGMAEEAAADAPSSGMSGSQAAAAASMPDGMPTEVSGELSTIAKAGDAVGSGGPRKEPARRAVKKSSGAFARDRKDIMMSLSEEPVTMDFESTDIREILRLMAAKAGINIVYGSDVTGVLTLHLTDVSFREAFGTILSMQGLVANQAGENILRVMTPATLQKERTVSINQTRIIRLKYSKAEDVRSAIDQVRAAEGRGGKLVTDAATNSLIVTDTLDGIASVERLLAQLDTRPQQVMIEAKLVEVKLTKDLHFGIQWDYFQMENGSALGKQGFSTIGSRVTPAGSSYGLPLDQNSFKTPGLEADQGPVGATARGTGVNLPASKVFGAFTLGRITNNYILSATLTAAASQGKVKVLSDPKITTLNGKKASINITTQIPYETSNVTATGVTSSNVAYVTTGIQLDVTPVVNADGRVTLDVNPRVSQPSATSAGTATGAPAVDSRDAKTVVLVQDGETIVIGGLITDSVSEQTAKIPLLGDIPFLGWFFKKKFIDRTRVELLIFVTTRVVPN